MKPKWTDNSRPLQRSPDHCRNAGPLTHPTPVRSVFRGSGCRESADRSHPELLHQWLSDVWSVTWATDQNTDCRAPPTVLDSGVLGGGLENPHAYPAPGVHCCWPGTRLQSHIYQNKMLAKPPSCQSFQKPTPHVQHTCAASHLPASGRV